MPERYGQLFLCEVPGETEFDRNRALSGTASACGVSQCFISITML